MIASIMMKLKNILSKYQKSFLGIAIILSSLAVSIRSSDGEVNLVLRDYPIVIFLMVVVSSFLVVLYVQYKKRKITDLSNQIKDQSKMKSEDIDSLLNELTIRQREVYDLIISGKSNKEIIAELFIEQSTLKTHINLIYRKLNIKSRRELKSKSST
jgi:ATP/maltotriose-dependent transcriptional regulator MalT